MPRAAVTGVVCHVHMFDPAPRLTYDVWHHINDPRTPDQREFDDAITFGHGRRRESVTHGLRADAYALVWELMDRYQRIQKQTQEPFRCVCEDIRDNARAANMEYAEQ